LATEPSLKFSGTDLTEACKRIGNGSRRHYGEMVSAGGLALLASQRTHTISHGRVSSTAGFLWQRGSRPTTLRRLKRSGSIADAVQYRQRVRA
jgi:hypothetical protein